MLRQQKAPVGGRGSLQEFDMPGLAGTMLITVLKSGDYGTFDRNMRAAML